MSRNTLIAVLVVLLLVGAGWYLMRPKASTTNYTTTAPTEAPQATTAPSASEGATMTEAKEIKVSGGDYSFTPNKLSVKKGDKVKIVFKNDGKFPHDLRIDELGVATKVINSGQTDTVEFTASKGGSFTMYCDVDAHRQKGMEGTVSVQ